MIILSVCNFFSGYFNNCMSERTYFLLVVFFLSSILISLISEVIEYR